MSVNYSHDGTFQADQLLKEEEEWRQKNGGRKSPPRANACQDPMALYLLETLWMLPEE